MFDCASTWKTLKNKKQTYTYVPFTFNHLFLLCNLTLKEKAREKMGVKGVT